jgi:putative PIN family toxin of toxin-antitoxin system
MLAELRRILGYDKIQRSLPLDEAELDELILLLAENAIDDPPFLFVEALTDKTDLMFLEAAAAAEADYLVTGDSALLRLGTYGVTQIVTPRRFLTILEAGTAT